MFDITRYNGGTAGDSMERELLRLFGPALTGGLSIFDRELRTVNPRLNLVEDEKEYRVTTELPGVDEKDVRVNVTKEGLEIAGEKKLETEEKGKNVYRFERSFGSFRRLVAIPEDADRSQAKASFKKGVLKITLPKRADAAPKKLDIQSE
jgi:HSP20 family protein